MRRADSGTAAASVACYFAFPIGFGVSVLAFTDFEVVFFPVSAFFLPGFPCGPDPFVMGILLGWADLKHVDDHL